MEKKRKKKRNYEEDPEDEYQTEGMSVIAVVKTLISCGVITYSASCSINYMFWRHSLFLFLFSDLEQVEPEEEPEEEPKEETEEGQEEELEEEPEEEPEEETEEGQEEEPEENQKRSEKRSIK